MMKRNLLLTTLFTAACGTSDAPDSSLDPSLPPLVEAKSSLSRNLAPNVPAQDLKALADGNHGLTLDLFGETSTPNENYLVSTLSIRTAFALVYAGAQGTTAQEMSDVLYFDADQSRFHAAMNALDLALADRALPADPAANLEALELRQANAFWGQTGYAWEAPYLDTLAVNYGAGVNLLDFAADPERARTTINTWVEGQTRQRIKDLLPEGSIRSNTPAVLTNALYLKAPWAAPFEPAFTQPGTFDLLSGGTATVDFMRAIEPMSYATGSGWTAVEIPFRGDELSMVFIVPDGGTFGAFARSMNTAQLESVIAALQAGLVDVSLPKFQFESGFTLKATLQRLGMTTPFSGEADLTGMLSRGGLYIDEAYHKTFIAIDEKGAEAAAATAVVVGETSAPIPDLTLSIDRPFIFMIRDRPTNTWLFFGQVIDPS